LLTLLLTVLTLGNALFSAFRPFRMHRQKDRFGLAIEIDDSFSFSDILGVAITGYWMRASNLIF